MKTTSSDVITHLNTVLCNQLTAINQYFLHARMYRNWGFGDLNSKSYKESICQMKHADKVIERILFLEGLPNLQDLGKLLIGENPKEMIDCDLNLVMEAISDMRKAIAYFETVEDFVSRDMLTDMLESNEDYVDWLETQVSLMDNIGSENYLQSKM